MSSLASQDIERTTALEYQWLRKQRRITGDRDSLYELSGVYAAWRDIFWQYVSLAKTRDQEALKRAIYLWWTQYSQEPAMSGVKQLDQEPAKQVLTIADKLVTKDGLDAELRWMLPYYYFLEPRYVDRFANLDELKRTSRQDALLYRTACLESSFDNRGHMGEYWRSKQAVLHRWP
jgi:hypothetical protein